MQSHKTLYASYLAKDVLLKTKSKMNIDERAHYDVTVNFCLMDDSNGVSRPTKEEQNVIEEVLAPVKAKAEKEITEILKKIEKEHSIYIWVDYKQEAKLTFIYPTTNIKLT